MLRGIPLPHPPRRAISRGKQRSIAGYRDRTGRRSTPLTTVLDTVFQAGYVRFDRLTHILHRRNTQESSGTQHRRRRARSLCLVHGAGEAGDKQGGKGSGQ